MPIFRLDDNLWFPPPEMADESGLLAVGGDLSNRRLLEAYRLGIFPWFNPDDPILWWAPDPRCVIFPEKIRISKSMRQVRRKETFRITFNTAFEEVMRACKDTSRPGQEAGSWITDEFVAAYTLLHRQGYAFSVEARNSEGRLVGGLYGLLFDKCFFGESMFSHESNASKAAFITLAKNLQQHDFELIDCQIENPHLTSLGAEMISRNKFSDILARQNFDRPAAEICFDPEISWND